MTSIKRRLQELRESYYLSSLEEQDPEGEAPPEAVPQEEVPAEKEPPPGSSPPDENGDFIDPQGMTRNVDGEFVPETEYGGMDEPQHTAKELGRIYELNKIYYRLYIITKILNNVPDPRIASIREMTNESFEMFRMISNNITVYKDMIDDIIVKYYAFIGRVVLSLEQFYKITAESDEDVKYLGRKSSISDSGQDKKTD